jgi:hypothetical protein
LELDLASAIHPIDRSALQSTESARSLVLDLLASTSPPRDLFNACARLGGLMADAGASPSAVAGMLDNAARVLVAAGVEVDPSRVDAARASAIEGYVASTVAAERQVARASWDFPACVVDLGDGAVAIACGHPSDDDEALADWAARIAVGLVKRKVRRAKLTGELRARAEVESALSSVGIAIAPDGDDGEARPSWLRRLWSK